MDSEEIKTLKEMGFSEDKAEKALNITGNRGVGIALEWLLSNSEENSEPSSSADVEGENEEDGKEEAGAAAAAGSAGAAGAAGLDGAAAAAAASAASGPAKKDDASTSQGETGIFHGHKSYKCEDCRKLLQSQLEMEYHAVKSGHNNFSESTEVRRPLTDEERKEQLRIIEEKMKQKRKERQERERKEEVEREKKRIQSGKELSLMREKLKEEEMKKMIEKHKRDKIEDQKARQRIKAQIEADKIARRSMFGDCASTAPAPTPAADPIPRPQKEYAEARIQIRLTNGTILTHTFASKEQLSAVRLFVQMNRTDGSDPFSMMTNFPKKVFTEEDYEKPLDALGLTPSAVIIVSKKV